MELETKNIIELHKIDKRLNQIEETKGDLPSIIEEQEETLNDLGLEDSKKEEVFKAIQSI